MKTSGDETDQIAHHGLGKINIETNDNSKKKINCKIQEHKLQLCRQKIN